MCVCVSSLYIYTRVYMRLYSKALSDVHILYIRSIMHYIYVYVLYIYIKLGERERTLAAREQSNIYIYLYTETVYTYRFRSILGVGTLRYCAIV